MKGAGAYHQAAETQSLGGLHLSKDGGWRLACNPAVALHSASGSVLACLAAVHVYAHAGGMADSHVP